MKRLLIIPLLLFTLELPSCASSGLRLKQDVTAGLQANEAALATARTSELDLYNKHLSAAWTAERHLAFVNLLIKGQEAEKKAAAAAALWHAGDPVPTDVVSYQAIATQITDALTVLNADPAAAELIRAGQRLTDQVKILVHTLEGK